MLSESLALAVAALFTGAALYVSAVEQPARLTLDDVALLAEWKEAYRRGAIMQGSLAILGFVLGMISWLRAGNPLLLAGALLMIANWPYTLLVIMPLNNMLKAMAPDAASAASRKMIERWSSLHAVRTALGVAAAGMFLLATAIRL